MLMARDFGCATRGRLTTASSLIAARLRIGINLKSLDGAAAAEADR
jgi:hypothetical protein